MAELPTPTQKMVPSDDIRDHVYAGGMLDKVVTSTELTYTDRLGGEHYTVDGIKAEGDAVVEETRQNLIPLSKQYMTLAAAQADIANIPDGSTTYVRSADGSSLADEYINNGGTLEATGRTMPSQTFVNQVATQVMEEIVTRIGLIEAMSTRSPYLAVIPDANGREAWGISKKDGSPTEHTIDVWMKKMEETKSLPVLKEIPGYGFVFSLPDSTGADRMTEMAILSKNGQFADWVLEAWALRLAPMLDGKITPGDESELRVTRDPPGFQILSSVTRGVARHASGRPLPVNPYSWTTETAQGSRLTFPAQYSDATPLLLVIVFEGVDYTSLDPRAGYAGIQNEGIIYARSAFHGNSYGSPDCMADAAELYRTACSVAPVGGVVIIGNSMGGIAACNAITTGTIPGVLGLYLTDPTFSLRQRYDSGRDATIRAAYGIASDGSDYDEKTAGYDPNLEHWSRFQGIPINIVASSQDTTVQFSENTMALVNKLTGHNDIDLLDVNSAGHNVPDRFIKTRLLEFIQTVCHGSISLEF
ncbi:Uncharacterised protein [Raoultella planticola]|uniref:alpha/beta hydrolase n=1 Tax=Raoultella planticola TaxID=575 RepID=UPI0010E849AB|nr:Uncharacterised protein [Raoultella planticola]